MGTSVGGSEHFAMTIGGGGPMAGTYVAVSGSPVGGGGGLAYADAVGVSPMFPATPSCPTHVLADDPIEYKDGVIIGECRDCAARIEINWVPGGTGVPRLRCVAELILSILEEGEDLPQSAMLDFLTAVDQVQADRDLADDALSLAVTIRKVIASHS